MYHKLAFRNVVKSYQEFMIYFVTLMFSVCLFYTFNSFQAQQEMMVLRESQNSIMGMVAIFMTVLSFFIAIILAFLILYANRFLIRRRKKEFGLYMLMGMEESRISRILIYETFLIGLASMICGLLLGFGLSHVLAIITAGLMEVDVDFHIVFSFSAMVMTIAAFSVMFLITLISNVRMIKKQKLIDLIQADKKQERQHLQRFGISIVLFLLALVLLGLTYYLATSSIISFGQNFLLILLLGSIGTLLFFFSLTGFLLRFISTSKTLYFRNLHMFVLRQVHSRINTSFLSMSIVCLMLLLSIGALATGWNLNLGVAQMYQVVAPYDMSYFQYDSTYSQTPAYDEELVAQRASITVYRSDVKMRELYEHMDDDEEMWELFATDIALNIIPYSQYVTFCKQKGMPIIPLKDDQYMLFSPMEDVVSMMNEVQQKGVCFNFYGQALQPATQTVMFQPLTDIFVSLDGVILPDSLIPENAEILREVTNFDLKEGVDITSFQSSFDAQIHHDAWKSVTRLEAYDNTISSGLLFTYIGLYLGVVFLMASAVILALQQLSEADHNMRQYEILRKIGVERSSMNHSIYEQIGLYFLLPLLLATIHAFFGIRAVAGSLSYVFGTGNLVKASLLSAGCIIIVYGIYFIFTVQGYKRILFTKS